MDIPGRKYFNGEVVYSDWFPRGGDDAIFRAERIAFNNGAGGDATVEIEFYTKNSEETTDGTAILDSGESSVKLTLNSTDTIDIKEVLIRSSAASVQPQGFLELVRLKITVGSADGDWMLVRIFPPIFFDRAEAS